MGHCGAPEPGAVRQDAPALLPRRVHGAAAWHGSSWPKWWLCCAVSSGWWFSASCKLAARLPLLFSRCADCFPCQHIDLASSLLCTPTRAGGDQAVPHCGAGCRLLWQEGLPAVARHPAHGAALLGGPGGVASRRWRAGQGMGQSIGQHGMMLQWHGRSCWSCQACWHAPLPSLLLIKQTCHALPCHAMAMSCCLRPSAMPCRAVPCRAHMPCVAAPSTALLLADPLSLLPLILPGA